MKQILWRLHVSCLSFSVLFLFSVFISFSYTNLGPKSGTWGQARSRAGPGRPKRARYFEKMKVQDRSHCHFAAIIIGFGAIWTQLLSTVTTTRPPLAGGRRFAPPLLFLLLTTTTMTSQAKKQARPIQGKASQASQARASLNLILDAWSWRPLKILKMLISHEMCQHFCQK